MRIICLSIAVHLALLSGAQALDQCDPRDPNYLKCLEDRANARSRGTNRFMCKCEAPHNDDLGCCDAKASGAIDPTCNTTFDQVEYVCGEQFPIQCCRK